MASSRTEISTLKRARARAAGGVRARRAAPRAPETLSARDEAEGGDRLKFSQVMVLFRRNIWLLAAVTLVSMALTFFSIQGRPPVYESKAQVVLDDGLGAAAEILFLLEYVDLDSSVVLTQKQVLASRTSLGQVVDQLDLVSDARFNPALRPASPYSLDGLARGVASLFGVEQAPKQMSGAAQREATVEEVRRSLVISLSINGLTVTIAARTKDPVRSAQIANAIVELHLQREAESRAAELARALGVLRERADNIRDRIDIVERKQADDFRTANLGDAAFTQELLSEIEQLEARRDTATGAEAAEFAAEIARAQAALEARTLAEVRRDQLLRELETDRERYQEVLQRIGALETGGSALRAERPPLSRATPPPEPMSKRLISSTILGGFGALMLALLGVFLAATVDIRVRDPRRIEAMLGAPCLAITPEFRLSKMGGAQAAALHETLRLHPRSPFTEAMRRLSIQIAHLIEGYGPQIIAVTSSIPGEGKSTMALCASLAARPNFRRIAIVDFDLRSGGLTHTLADGADVTERLAQRHIGAWLDGETSVARLPGGFRSAPGVDVLPALPDPERPIREVTAEQVAELFDFLRESYDLVILDLPPILPFGDVEMIAPHCDGVLFVVGWEMLNESALQSSAKLLARAKAPTLGAVVNRVELRRSSAAAAIAFRRKQLREQKFRAPRAV